MKQLILTVGASCSGKTTWAEEFIKGRLNWVNLNRDEVRFSLFTGGKRDWTKYKFKKSNEERVSQVINQLAYDATLENDNIVVSDTNLNPKIREEWKKFAEENGYCYSEKVFPCDWDELVKRNNQREGGISQSVLWSQYLRMNDYLGRKTYKPDTSKKDVFICDIDGTIASMQGIRKPFEWNKVGLDLPRLQIINMVEGLINSGVEPIFLSGRDGVCVDETYKWINDNLMQHYGSGFHLYMRNPNDNRKDTVVKEELFWKYVEPNFNVVACIDDRPCMVRLWYELKIPNVVAVADPLKEF